MSCGYCFIENIRLNGIPRSGGEVADQHLVVFGPFRLVLDRRAGPFVRPAGQRLAKVGGEDGVRDLMRQHAVENPLGLAESTSASQTGAAGART